MTTSTLKSGAIHNNIPACQYFFLVKRFIAQIKQAAAGIAELAYIAIAYISGRSIAANNIIVRLYLVMYFANSTQPTKKAMLKIADTRQ